MIRSLILIFLICFPFQGIASDFKWPESVGVTKEEADLLLKGDGSSTISIKIFGRYVMLPNTYVVDAVSTPDVIFDGEKGKVVLGDYKSFVNSESYEWYKEHQRRSFNFCGLNAVEYVADEVTLTTIHDEKHFLMYVGDDPKLWKASLVLFCMECCENASNKAG